MVHERRKGMQYLSYLYIKLFTRLLWCAYMFYSTRCYTYTRIVAGWSAGYSLRTLWSVWEDSWPVWWTFRTAALEDNTHGERECVCVCVRERERERERRERERERAERERESRERERTISFHIQSFRILCVHTFVPWLYNGGVHQLKCRGQEWNIPYRMVTLYFLKLRVNKSEHSRKI